MRHLRPVPIKKMKKDERIHEVLLGLVRLYVEEGKPVGSNTLKENGFDDLSSATIRNYFAKLEGEGYLSQPHVSGGRIPTGLAFKEYAAQIVEEGKFRQLSEQWAKPLYEETHRVGQYLQRSADFLSEAIQLPVFISSPRFDQDFIVGIKVVEASKLRYVCIIETDFGQVLTEVFHLDHKLSSFDLKRLERYFRWRITGLEKPQGMSEAELKQAETFYQEVMLRYLVKYSNFSHEDVYRTGFSQLIAYPEFYDGMALGNALALFENVQIMREILNFAAKRDELGYIVGKDLEKIVPKTKNCAVLTVPYRIHHTTVGAVGLLAPMRCDYAKLFGMLETFSETMTRSLTKSIYKYKISYRQPEKKGIFLTHQQTLLLEDNS